MARKRPPPFQIDLRVDESDLDGLFSPFDPLNDAVHEPDLPALPASPGFHDPIDWAYLKSMGPAYIEDIIDHYFRAEIYGADKVPLEGPLIVAPNHSGTAFPHDAMVMDYLLWRHQGFHRRAKFRSVFSPKLASVRWMRPFGLDNWWRRCGGIDMTFDNYDRLLARGEKVIYYPEGIPGIGKGLSKRYQLQHYYSSFIVLAARHDAPIYPVSVVNAEWVNPAGFTFKPIDRFFDRWLGIPFFPIPIMLLVLVFPFMFYLAFPCKMVFLIGDPIDVRRLLREVGCLSPSAPQREEALKAAAHIRDLAQQQLDEGVLQYGDKPYALRSFYQSMKKLRGRIFRISTLGWPFAYVQHDRDHQRAPARNRLHALLRDLDLLAFYLPFGWILLVLFRKLRKPPYGYRGLTSAERREREGVYRWSLATNPLPTRSA